VQQIQHSNQYREGPRTGLGHAPEARTCHNCKKPGHIARNCRSNKPRFNQYQQNRQKPPFNRNRNLNQIPSYRYLRKDTNYGQNVTGNNGWQQRPFENRRQEFGQYRNQPPIFANKSRNQQFFPRQQQQDRHKNPNKNRQNHSRTNHITKIHTKGSHRIQLQITLNVIFHQIKLLRKDGIKKLNDRPFRMTKQWLQKRMPNISQSHQTVVQHPPPPMNIFWEWI